MMRDVIPPDDDVRAWPQSLQALPSEEHAMSSNAPATPASAKARSSVWNINTSPFPEAHFAVFPPALVEPCILAGSNEGDLVLDPFFGSGTVGEVCVAHGRRFVGIELSDEYADVAARRLDDRAGYTLPTVREW